MRRYTALLLLACIFVQGHAIAAQAYPVQLSSADRGSITTAACMAAGDKGAERITATTTQRGSSRIEATVQCRPHRSEGTIPVAHRTTCHNRSGPWVCAKGQDAAQVTIREDTDDRTVVTVLARGITLAAAADAVSRSSKMTYPPFTEQAWPLFKGSCSVGVIPSPDREGLTRFAIDCSGGQLVMHKLCWKEGCRHFNVSGEMRSP